MTEERKEELRHLLQEAIENLEIRCRPEVRDQFRSIDVDKYRSYLQEHWATHSNSRDAALVEFNYNLHIVDEVTKSKLLDFLREEFAAFIHKDKIQSASSFIHVGWPDGHPLDSLLDQFLKIAIAHGIEQAVSSFDRCTRETHGSFQVKALLEGISLKEEIQVFEDMRLVPIRGTELEHFHHLSGLPIINSDKTIFFFHQKTLLIIDCSVSPIFYKPPQVITEGYRVKEDPAFRVEINGKNFSESEIDDFYEKFCQALSLACNLAIQFSRKWRFLTEDEFFNLKCAYLIDRNPGWSENSGYGSLIEHEQSKIDEAKRLYEILVNLDSGVGEKLQIPISRWIQSKTSANSVDKMIDLGIAFESLYVPGKVPGKRRYISRNLQNNASRYLGKDKADQEILRTQFKAIYEHRCDAAHEGRLDEEVEVDRKIIPMSEFITEAQDLCRQSIIKILEDGEFPDWNNLILG